MFGQVRLLGSLLKKTLSKRDVKREGDRFNSSNPAGPSTPTEPRRNLGLTGLEAVGSQLPNISFSYDELNTKDTLSEQLPDELIEPFVAEVEANDLFVVNIEFEADEEDDFDSGLLWREWRGANVASLVTARAASEDEETVEWKFSFDRVDPIEAEDLSGRSSGISAEDSLEAFVSFEKVRWSGRKSATKVKGPSTRGWSITLEVVVDWANEIIAHGGCDGEALADLLHHVQGDFPAEDLLASLRFAFMEEGFWKEPDDIWDISWNGDVDDIVDLVTSICNGSNLRPGVEHVHVTRSTEQRMLGDILKARQAVLEIIAKDHGLRNAVMVMGHALLENPHMHREMTPIFKSGIDPNVLETFRQAVLNLAGADSVQAAQVLKALHLSVDFMTKLPAIAKGTSAATCAELLGALEQLRAVREAMLIASLPALRRLATRRMQDQGNAEDSFQDGFFGLERSLDAFDPTLGNLFITYAQYGIRHAIQRAAENSRTDIRIPIHMQQRIARIDTEIAAFEVLHGRAPEPRELPEIKDLPVEDVIRILRYPRVPVPFEDEHLDTTANHERIEDWFAMAHELGPCLDAMLDGLTERGKEILAERFGLHDGEEKTLEAIGQAAGVTRERIRQIEAKALDYLRHPSRKKVLWEFLQ